MPKPILHTFTANELHITAVIVVTNSQEVVMAKPVHQQQPHVFITQTG